MHRHQVQDVLASNTCTACVQRRRVSSMETHGTTHSFILPLRLMVTCQGLCFPIALDHSTRVTWNVAQVKMSAVSWCGLTGEGQENHAAWPRTYHSVPPRCESSPPLPPRQLHPQSPPPAGWSRCQDSGPCRRLLFSFCNTCQAVFTTQFQLAAWGGQAATPAIPRCLLALDLSRGMRCATPRPLERHGRAGSPALGRAVQGYLAWTGCQMLQYASPHVLMPSRTGAAWTGCRRSACAAGRGGPAGKDRQGLRLDVHLPPRRPSIQAPNPAHQSLPAVLCHFYAPVAIKNREDGQVFRQKRHLDGLLQMLAQTGLGLQEVLAIAGIRHGCQWCKVPCASPLLL
jgi:hypothetical protein